MTRSARSLSLVFAVVTGLLAPGFSSAQTPPPDSLNDGPHVYWQSDSTALAFYQCDGSFQRSELLPIRVAVSMRGFCGDSHVEYVLSPKAPAVEPDTFDEVPRIFAVSDIHGEYDALVRLLVNTGIVGEDLSWVWGEGHLVILGDVFDRGGRVTECLWLIHRLEREARAVGGRVHYLLGNHEVMALQRDLRYVNPKYLEGVVKTSGVEYQDLFGPRMELGRWLRTKHTAIRLNGLLFVHGGIGPEVLKRNLDLTTINRQAREAIDLRSYDLIFNDMPGFLLDGEGPLWYRGYHGATATYPQATEEEVRTILGFFGAEAVVVGHTDIGEVAALYGGLVFGIDMSLEKQGSFQGLLWEGGVFFKVQGDGAREPIALSTGEPGGDS